MTDVAKARQVYTIDALQPNPQRAVVLFSGGMDSTTLLALACWEYREVHPLSFQYGQRHQVELWHAQRIAGDAGLPWRWVDLAGLADLWEGAPLMRNAPDTLPTRRRPEEIAAAGASPAIVPGRNMIFISYGVALAAALGGGDVLIGCNADDAAGFPDCGLDFLAAARSAAQHGSGVRLRAPLVKMTKPQIVAMGRNLGVDFSRTWSCYRPVSNTPCGQCDACSLRAGALEGARVWP
jgi:7-cyano-7-deazaguanine synthase